MKAPSSLWKGKPPAKLVGHRACRKLGSDEFGDSMGIKCNIEGPGTQVAARRGAGQADRFSKNAGDISRSPPSSTEWEKSLSAGRSGSHRRKKVDLKSKLQMRNEELYLPPPLLFRKNIRIEKQLIFFCETNCK